MKTDVIFRALTILVYVVISLATSVQLPEKFCELIGQEDDSFTSCKWQVFGFRLVFILLTFPLEIVFFAVVYRFATDMIFKI